jgi:hypothetical protein
MENTLLGAVDWEAMLQGRQQGGIVSYGDDAFPLQEFIFKLF